MPGEGNPGGKRVTLLCCDNTFIKWKLSSEKDPFERRFPLNKKSCSNVVLMFMAMEIGDWWLLVEGISLGWFVGGGFCKRKLFALDDGGVVAS